MEIFFMDADLQPDLSGALFLFLNKKRKKRERKAEKLP